MADVPLPNEIRNWMRARNWGQHHMKWHAERQWDRLPSAAQAEAIANGWRRYRIQEGEAGNGLEFLVMHRAMIELLLAKFPAHAALFAGWAAVPTNPLDPNDPVPPGQPQVFDADKLAAVTLFQSNPGFASIDDAFGLFLETSWRPLPGRPRNRSTNPQTGLHNYLHNRFSVAGSPINMGDAEVNIENERFWKLHGWIDKRWSAFRTAKGLPAEDPALRAAIEAEKTHLDAPHIHDGLLAIATNSVTNIRSRSLREPFASTLSADFEALRADTPQPRTIEEVRAYLQVAIRLELATLPLYLTAAWSLKPGAATSSHTTIFSNIYREEMLHMGLACNLLVALGGVPEFATTANVIQFPDNLPGIEPTTPFVLQAFSEAQIRRFMEIEKPAHGPIPDLLAAVPTFPTIGDFYAALLAGLKALTPAPNFDATHQVAAELYPHTLFVIRDMAAAEKAIQTIMEQGEGTTQSQGTIGPEGPQLAHYYAFNQMVRQMMYTKQTDDTWRLDPARPLPMPVNTSIRAMAPIPIGGYPTVPEAKVFDQKYSDMLRALQRAWTGATPDDDFNAAVGMMWDLPSLAITLMEKDRAPVDGTGKYGPAFRFVPPLPPAPPAPGVAALASVQPAARPTATPGFARIQRILDDATSTAPTFGPHGAFWRDVTRDAFVAMSVLGRALIAKKPDGSFDPEESNLVKALEGRPPFGRDLVPRPAGSNIRRMPAGLPPVSPELIAEVRAWIAAGCPDAAPMPFVRAAGGQTLTDIQHMAFWREFDNRFLFEATPAMRADINTFFTAAFEYQAFAAADAGEPAWVAALTDPLVKAAHARLEAAQREEFLRHYGRPLSLAAVLDSFTRFGSDEFPDDPLRPQAPRHRMDGEIMWANWAASVDAALRLAPANPGIPADFWTAIGRGVLLGFLHDGVVRGRFTITGFANTPAGRAAMRAHAETLPANDLAKELIARLRASGVL